MKTSSFVGFVLTSSSLLQGDTTTTTVLGFSLPSTSSKSTKGNLLALGVEKRLQLLEETATTESTGQQQEKGQTFLESLKDAQQTQQSVNEDGTAVVVTSGIVRKPLLEASLVDSLEELGNNAGGSDNSNPIFQQQQQQLPRNWQALVDSVSSGALDDMAAAGQATTTRTFTRYPTKWAALRSYARVVEEEQQWRYAEEETAEEELSATAEAQRGEEPVIVSVMQESKSNDDFVGNNNNDNNNNNINKVPSSVFQFVRDWVLTLDTLPPLNTVYFQLRNMNVAAFAAAGKSRWSSPEVNRALYQMDLMQSAVMTTATSTPSSSFSQAVVVEESTPIVVVDEVVVAASASEKEHEEEQQAKESTSIVVVDEVVVAASEEEEEEQAMQDLEEKEPSIITSSTSSSSVSNIVVATKSFVTARPTIGKPLGVISDGVSVSSSKKLQRSKLRGNERSSSMDLRESSSMVNNNDPIIRFSVVTTTRLSSSFEQGRPINKFPAIVPLRPSLTPRRAEFLSTASVVGNKIVFLKKEAPVVANGGVIVNGVLWTPMVLQEQQQQQVLSLSSSSNLVKMETSNQQASSSMMASNDKVVNAAKLKQETADYMLLNLPATYVLQRNLPAASA